MELIEAVGVALSQRYALGRKNPGREPSWPITQPRGLKLRLKRIMGSEGFPTSRRKQAEAVGIPYSTWGHILSGRTVSPKNLAKITAAYGRLVTAPAMAAVVKRRGLPAEWHIWAVVVARPNGSRYINGRPPGLPPEEIWHINTPPEWRMFRAEGLDSGRIVNDWITGGAEGATATLMDEIDQVYGEDEFGFEGDHVEVELHD